MVKCFQTDDGFYDGFAEPDQNLHGEFGLRKFVRCHLLHVPKPVYICAGKVRLLLEYANFPICVRKQINIFMLFPGFVKLDMRPIFVQNVSFHQQSEPYRVHSNTCCNLRQTLRLHRASIEIQTDPDTSTVAGSR